MEQWLLRQRPYSVRGNYTVRLHAAAQFMGKNGNPALPAIRALRGPAGAKTTFLIIDAAEKAIWPRWLCDELCLER